MHLFLREIPVCYMYFPKCSCNTKNQIDKNEEHMYYLIKYEESVENRVAIALTENPQNEIAVLALADYEDETISIDEIYCILSEGQTDLADITYDFH